MSEAPVTFRVAACFRELRRAAERAGDQLRLYADALVREHGREWDPDLQHLLLDDDDRAALEARAMGRTLEEIDDLEQA